MVALIVVTSSLVFGQQGNPERKFEIIANMVSKTAHVRSMSVFLPEDEFNRDSVSGLLGDLRSQFCKPYTLTISIFSDREMLKKQLASDAADIVDFANTPAGQKAAAEYLAKTSPPETGYLRAFYRRNSDFEYFTISPSTESPEMETVGIADSTGMFGKFDFVKLPVSPCKSSETR